MRLAEDVRPSRQEQLSMLQKNAAAITADQSEN